MSLFIHLYGSQFPLNNRQTLQVSANPELTHSQSFIHSNVTVVWLQRQWAPELSTPDHGHDNSPSYSGLRVTKTSVTLDSISPSGTTKGVRGREGSGHNLH